MGTPPVPLTAEATGAITSPPAATVPVSHTAPTALALADDEPWLRAMILTPNARAFLSTTKHGERDYTQMRSFMTKPSTALLMGFADDPSQGLATDRFSGEAVVFIATITFARRTAALQ
jgi:hypothetical protein